MKMVMAVSVLVLVGCGGGSGDQGGEVVNNGLSKEYSGITDKATATGGSNDTIIKFHFNNVN